MTTKRTNDVTLFSNGMGHFRRIYTIAAGKEESISIPFKTDCIGDVAASLQVFGKVRLNTPPSFTPANSYATALRINQNESLKSLLTQLSGSQVKLTVRNQPVAVYTLLGLDTETSYVDSSVVTTTYVVAMKNGAVRRFLLSDVTDVSFEDEGVRTEIEKALKSNFQKIKPDSTLLDLSLSSLDDKEVECAVQYTIPVAAWKMRYAIREEKDKFSIEGAAIIDNNTDEDWHDFKVSVVTGNPISFNTDIADVVVPTRKMVYLVDRTSQGNISVQEGYSQTMSMACAAPMPKGMDGSRANMRAMGAKMSTANYAGFGLESARGGSIPQDDANSLMQMASGDANLDLYYAAEAAGVDSKDVGDFCVFTSKEPITILARKSAVVPMFSKPLDQAGIVLLYKESNNSRRPYRSVKFKNETEFTLGRGKTIIYNEGLFSGECVLENTKPGENRMLPHCLENGVKIIKEDKGQEQRRSSLKLSDGVGVTEDVMTALTDYVIENKKDEPFKVALEHSNSLYGANVQIEFEGVEVKEKEKLADGDGWRVYFELKAKENLKLKVVEVAVQQSSVILGSNFHWIRNNIITSENPLSSDKQILACIAAQKEIDDLLEKQNSANARLRELTEQVDRVRENLSAVKDVTTSATIDKWVQDLESSETEIREINKSTIPSIIKKTKEATKKLADELKKVTVSWKDSTVPKTVKKNDK